MSGGDHACAVHCTLVGNVAIVGRHYSTLWAGLVLCPKGGLVCFSLMHASHEVGHAGQGSTGTDSPNTSDSLQSRDNKVEEGWPSPARHRVRK